MGFINASEETSVANPSSGYSRLYPKTDGFWYSKGDDNVERPVTLAPNVVTDAMIGDRTGDQSLAAPASTGPLTSLLGWIMGRIKAITGETNWYDTPDTTIDALNTSRGTMQRRLGSHAVTWSLTGTTLQSYTTGKILPFTFSLSIGGASSGSAGVTIPSYFTAAGLIPGGVGTGGIMWDASMASATSLTVNWRYPTGITPSASTATIIGVIFGE